MIPADDPHAIRITQEVVEVRADAPSEDQTVATAPIRDDIEQTRTDLSETIDAIQDRLNPQRVADDVKKQVQEATIGRAQHMVDDAVYSAREAGNGVLDTIRENPVPAAIAALGLGWLWFSRQKSAGVGRDDARVSTRHRRYDEYPGRGYSQRRLRATHDTGRDGDYQWDRGDADMAGQAARGVQQVAGHVQYAAGQAANSVQQATDTVQQMASQAGQAVQGAAGQAADSVQQATDTVQQMASQAGQAVQGAAGQVQDTAQQLGSHVQHGTMRVRWSVQDALSENPLAAGAIALAAGLAVGLAAPTTDFENRMLGETRDRVLDQAQEKAQDTLERVQHVAQRSAESAQHTAQEEAKRQQLTTA